MKNFVAQYCNLILYALRDPQPVKADECVCDVVGAFQIEDQPCLPLHSEPTGVGALGGQEYPPTRVAIVQPGMHQGNYQLLECGGRYISADLTQLTKSGKATRHRFIADI